MAIELSPQWVHIVLIYPKQNELCQQKCCSMASLRPGRLDATLEKSSQWFSKECQGQVLAPMQLRGVSLGRAFCRFLSQVATGVEEGAEPPWPQTLSRTYLVLSRTCPYLTTTYQKLFTTYRNLARHMLNLALHTIRLINYL